MYGYEPPKHDPNGSWLEVLVMIRVAFEVLALPLLILFGTLGLLVLTVLALFSQPILALIPVSIIALGIWWLIRRDRRLQAEMQSDLDAAERRYR